MRGGIPVGKNTHVNQIVKISKSRKSNFASILETKIEEKFEKIEEWYGRKAILASIGSHINENEKKK